MNFKYRPLLHRFTQLLVLATFALIFIGGAVTSKQAGLAVPDWPLSYGSLNPPGWWHIENVRLEHGHRLFATFVGFLTTTLMIWIGFAEKRRWMRWLGVLAFFLVLFQGILGGLRVTLISTELAIVHACMAQAFFCLTIFLALATSSRWGNYCILYHDKGFLNFRNLSLGLFILVYLQLILGASMRHLEAGLAIPDFPLAFGTWIPPFVDPKVIVHFAHRMTGLSIAVFSLINLIYVMAKWPQEKRLFIPLLALIVLIGFQIFLGANIIWHQKPFLITTLHVLVGASILGMSLVLAVRAKLLTYE